MKKILLLLLLLVTSISYGQKDPLIPEDKIAHFSAGYFIAGAGYFGSHLFMSNDFKKTQPKKAHAIGQITGFVLGVLVGHLKEQHDKSLGAPYDKKDRNATIAGAGSFFFTMELFAKKEHKLIF